MRHLTSGTWSWTTWTLIALVVTGGAYLIYDHGRHLAPYLPYALLLGIFAMHLIPGGHGGHGGSGGHGSGGGHGTAGGQGSERDTQGGHSHGKEPDTAGAEKKTTGGGCH